MDGCRIDGSDFCRVSLAESGARTTDICRRDGNGVDVWARAKRHSACDWTSPVGGARGVGVPNGLAPPYARRAGVLRLAVIKCEGFLGRFVSADYDVAVSAKFQLESGLKSGLGGVLICRVEKGLTIKLA